MAFRKRTYRKKKRSRRVAKKRVFKRYTKKRVVTRRKKRSFKGPRVNASLNTVRFKIRINLPDLEINGDAHIKKMIDNQDLTHFRLARNMPMLNNYNQFRVDKVDVFWRDTNIGKQREFRWTYSKKALTYHVQNDTNVAAFWGSTITDPDQDTTTNSIAFSLLKDPTQLAGCKVKVVNPLRGKVSFRPYLTEQITTLAKQNPDTAPVTINDIRMNYSRRFHYKVSQVQYENPMYMVISPVELLSRNQKGTLVEPTLNINYDYNTFEKNDYYPKLERWAYVYVTARQCNQFYTAGLPNRSADELPEPIYNPLHHITERVLNSNYEPIVNGLHETAEKIKEEVKDQVQNEILNSHPMINAAAGLLGLSNVRKRIRHDEIK